jgi:hypothetical protein
MGLVDMDTWLAARGLRGSSPATTGSAPTTPAAGLPDETAGLYALVHELEGEIARQGDLIRQLQQALATELDRSAKLIARIQGVPVRGRPGQAPVSRRAQEAGGREAEAATPVRAVLLPAA